MKQITSTTTIAWNGNMQAIRLNIPHRQDCDVGNATVFAALDEGFRCQIVFSKREKTPRAGRGVAVEQGKIRKYRDEHERGSEGGNVVRDDIAVGQAAIRCPVSPGPNGGEPARDGQEVHHHDQTGSRSAWLSE